MLAQSAQHTLEQRDDDLEPILLDELKDDENNFENLEDIEDEEGLGAEIKSSIVNENSNVKPVKEGSLQRQTPQIAHVAKGPTSTQKPKTVSLQATTINKPSS